jgi:3-demethoxyubiquinol 3-hydroxylase
MNTGTDTDSMVRVNQAGEYGATRIYAGQLAIMNSRLPAAREIARMAAQEERHRQTFDKMIADRRIRPTLLAPLWNIAGYGLGMATALIGPEAAMACTVAIETEIDRHYGEQLVELGDSDPELSAAVADFQAEEVEHKEIALAAGAERALAFPVMSAAIRFGCRTAIALSKRI